MPKLLSHLASPTLEGFLKNPICFSSSRSQFVIKGQGGLTVRSTLLATPFSVTSCVFKREKRCLYGASAVLPAQAESSLLLSFIPCTKGICPLPLSSPTHDLLWHSAIPHH